jgi:pimeloyl-ACP methyl ester carboxylesterase
MLGMITSPLLFRPPTRPPASAFRKDSKNIQVCCLDGSHVHCHLVCPWDMDTSIDNYQGTKSLLLFFHGNNEDVRSSISYCQWLADHTQSNVLTCDYPGYGYSSGDPSEEGMQDAAVAVFDLATSKLRHATNEIYVIGKSIGSAPAIGIASKAFCRDLGGLVLIAPVASGVRCLSASTKIPEIILTQMDTWVLPNIQYISLVQCPIQFVHGLEDNVVPCSNSRCLIARLRAPPHTPPLWVQAGHNDIESRWQAEFLQCLHDFMEVCYARTAYTSPYTI